MNFVPYLTSFLKFFLMLGNMMLMNIRHLKTLMFLIFHGINIIALKTLGMK